MLKSTAEPSSGAMGIELPFWTHCLVDSCGGNSSSVAILMRGEVMRNLATSSAGLGLENYHKMDFVFVVSWLLI